MAHAFLRAQGIYAEHVIALVRPGNVVPTFAAHQVEAGDLASWSTDELQIMIDEGRRQSDRQQADLELIRGRAQWLFAVGLPLIIAIATIRAEFHKTDSCWWTVPWAISLLISVYGVLGAAAIMTVRADFDMIDTAALSNHQRPILRKLADDYAVMLATGENTVATRLTVYRQAVVWLIIGGLGALVVWLAVK